MRLKSRLDATHQLKSEAVDDEELLLGELPCWSPDVGS
jgi:hypothetical protein